MTYCQSKGGIPYFETSAKEAINVEQAFEGECPAYGPGLFSDPASYRATSPCPGRSRRFRLWLPRDHPDRSQEPRRRLLLLIVAVARSARSAYYVLHIFFEVESGVWRRIYPSRRGLVLSVAHVQSSWSSGYIAAYYPVACNAQRNISFWGAHRVPLLKPSLPQRKSCLR